MTETVAAPILTRDRLAIVASLAGITCLAWVYLWFDAAHMSAMHMAGEMNAKGSPWAPGSLAMVFAMWSIMMVGMMLPSAAPAVLLYGGMVRKNAERGKILPSVWTFTAGYLAVWTGFSLTVTILQAGLESAQLLTPMMVSASAWLNGVLLVAAGVYQWLPIKDVCLQKCRAPLQFFMFNWRPGKRGAFAMGAHHGLYCVGCCWALMLLLFTAGVMNLLWVALIAAFVLLEKLMPAGAVFGRIAGMGMVGGGLWLMLSGA